MTANGSRRSVYVSPIQFRYKYENWKLEIAYRISMYRHLCDHKKQKHTIRFATTPFREQSNIELTVSIFPSDVIETTEMDSSVPIFILSKPLIELHAVRRAHFPIFVKCENWKYERRQNYARGWGGAPLLTAYLPRGAWGKRWAVVTRGRPGRSCLECHNGGAHGLM